MTSKECMDECPNCGSKNIMFRGVDISNERQEVDLNYTCRSCCQEFSEIYKMSYTGSWYEEEPFS